MTVPVRLETVNNDIPLITTTAREKSINIFSWKNVSKSFSWDSCKTFRAELADEIFHPLTLDPSSPSASQCHLL